LLGYVEQVEQLSEALHSRTDIGIAVGVLMERYQIDRHRAFGALSRISQTGISRSGHSVSMSSTARSNRSQPTET
jgi:hypothetical protein